MGDKKRLDEIIGELGFDVENTSISRRAGMKKIEEIETRIKDLESKISELEKGDELCSILERERQSHALCAYRMSLLTLKWVVNN